MKRSFTGGLAAATMWLSLTVVPASAQEVAPAAPATLSPADEAWSYRTPPPRVEKLTLAQEKSIARGQQRTARIESMRWYGFSASRPTASGMPWTTMYAPAWQQPGGRPFAWHTSTRPVVIYTTQQSIYR